MQKQHIFKSKNKLASVLLGGVMLFAAMFGAAFGGFGIQNVYAAAAQTGYWDSSNSSGYWSSTMSAPLQSRHGTATDLNFANYYDNLPYGFYMQSPSSYQVWYDVYGISLRTKIGGVWYVQDYYDADTFFSTTGYNASFVNLSKYFDFIVGQECEFYAYAKNKYSGVFYRSGIMNFTPTTLIDTQSVLAPSATISYHNVDSTAGWKSSYNRFDTFTLPIPPNKSDYAFAGWYTNGDFTGNPIIILPAGSGGNKDFYAKWVYAYDLVELPPDPVKTGFDFIGWFYDSAFTIPYDYLPIYSNTELYAKFEAIVYNIGYILNGGEMSGQPTTYTIESDGFTLPIPSRTGYTFKGWYTLPDFSGDVVTTIPKGSIGHRNYYAKWEINRFTVTFYVDGAVYKTMEVDYGTTLGRLGAEPTLAMYSIQSVEYRDGRTPTATENGFIVEGNAVMYLEAKTGVDAATGWAQANWQTILWLVLGGIGLIAVISLIVFFVRRKKNSYGR